MLLANEDSCWTREVWPFPVGLVKDPGRVGDSVTCILRR
jgi:hypothetical protein